MSSARPPLGDTSLCVRTGHRSEPAKADLQNLRAAKEDILKDVHRILCFHLGTPPDEIDWQWVDKKKKFHRDGRMTPQAFARKYRGSAEEQADLRAFFRARR